uniref:Aldolase_II domain-containing protein n=1 Tax=Mesocestoides corti TaxID=53468 RepID=A0A5K3F6G5_MESCO
MAQQVNSKILSGDGPDAKENSSRKQCNSTPFSIPDARLLGNSNAKGALQQLNELLNMHVAGRPMNDFGGTTPTIPINDLRGDEAARYTREERLIRCQIAALCRLIDLNGWTQSIYNHISAKCSQGEYLINPFGLLYHEVQASTLVKVNEHGSVLDPGSTVLGVNKAGWCLHSAVHSTRDDVNCVAHIHLPDVVAVSCIKSGLLPVSPEAAELLPTVRYHNYAGIVTDSAEADAIRADLGSGKILFLRNKGVTVAASTIPEAWYLMKRVISACQTQMRLLQLGCGTNLLNELVVPPSAEKDTPAGTEGVPEQVSGCNDDVQHTTLPESHSSTNGDVNVDDHLNGIGAKSTSSGVTDLSGWGVGEMEFEAQMRMLDSAGYRTGYAYRNPNLLRRQPTEMPWSASTTQRQQTDDFFTGFLSDSTVADASDVDDVAAATQAGAAQMTRIACTVKSNKEKGFQRNQWLSKTGSDRLFASRTPAYQSTPLNGQHIQESVEELAAAAAIPPLDLAASASSGFDKATPTKSGRKSMKSPFSPRNRSKGKIEAPECVIEEPRTPPTPRADLASRSASLPAHARNLVKFPARFSNSLEPVDGIVSDDEEHKLKAEKKKSRWGSFRFPTFKKKVKQAPSAV